MYWCGDTGASGLECVLDCLYCMLQQHRAVGLQTDCMVAVPAPVVRLPDSHVYALYMALGYGLPPCNNNMLQTSFQRMCSTSH